MATKYLFYIQYISIALFYWIFKFIKQSVKIAHKWVYNNYIMFISVLFINYLWIWGSKSNLSRNTVILDCGDIYECDAKIQSTEDSQADISKIIFFGFSTEFYILHVIYSSVQKILPEFNFLLAVEK